jgi:hypothetical protein
VSPLAVTDAGQVLAGEHEDLALVDATELNVDVEVLLVQRLEDRVQQVGHQRGRGHLHHLGTSLPMRAQSHVSARRVGNKREEGQY